MQTTAMEITVSAGDQAQPAGPVSWKPAKPLNPAVPYVLQRDGRPPVATQLDADGRLWWWCEPIEPGRHLTWRLETLPPTSEAVTPDVTLGRNGDGFTDFIVRGKPFVRFHFGTDASKPFLYPVIGPTGDPVTRDYPMADNPVEKKNKRQDHPHHRSIWTAHGDVRVNDFSKPGSNYWNEVKGKKNDVERVKTIVRTVGGPVFGQVQAEIEWINKDGRRELTEQRTYTFFAGDADCRVIDQKSVFKFTDGDVMFADTKEGGLVSVRLAVTMDEQGADGRHGRMCNANGQAGEKQCWGKPADWCDYVGPVNGKTVGIAIMDNPANLRHPQPWHIRSYGLFTANPFGTKAFTGDKTKDGSKTWKKGETTEFSYRILIHKGDTKAARIADEYQLYAHPPKVTGQ